MPNLPPLSLYIHIPWCVRKCPYCDFNSHTTDDLPVDAYLDSLTKDLSADLTLIQDRPIQSIFIGGGTPSLFPGRVFQTLLNRIKSRVDFANECEITLECNPGTAEFDKFEHYLEAGINRLSLGVQSFNAQHLSKLGRIHDGEDAQRAFKLARNAGFRNINIDIMHGLPNQTDDEALRDIDIALSLDPEHISWYQLTIEPNTAFYSTPPQLPKEDLLWQIQEQGAASLRASGYHQYEVSAFAKTNRQSQHNLNYWQFGDYLGIGAGAHAKISQPEDNLLFRQSKTRAPKDYLSKESDFVASRQIIVQTERPLEFMMNALRLCDGVPTDFFEARTFMPFEVISDEINNLRTQGLMQQSKSIIAPTTKGQLFLNTILGQFLN